MRWSMETSFGRYEGRRSALNLAGGAVTRRHRLVMARLIIPLDGALELRAGPSSVVSREPIYTPPGLMGTVATTGRTLSLFLDPLTPQARCPQPLERSKLLWIRDAARELRDLERDGREVFRTIVSRLASSALKLDGRVARAAGWLDQHPETPWSMMSLSRRVGLSSTHLAHLFQREVGISARTLSLHYRALSALGRVADGAPLARAAHGAGFADQAHFTRVSVRLLGQPPGVIRSGRIVQNMDAQDVLTSERE